VDSTAQAKDATDTLVTTIRAGVWKGSQLEISCEEVKQVMKKGKLLL